jgi:single-stranded-DNA-specific exonuclease
MSERWRLRPRNPEAEAVLRRELELHPLLAQLLVQRGHCTPEQAHAFLNPRLRDGLRSPFLFRGMRCAADRVVQALARGERIAIYGDYDLDGVSGSALLYAFLRSLGTEPIVYIPDRMREGYGLHQPAIASLAQSGTGLLITVDCGAASHSQIRFATQLGLDSIVCDHHQVPAEPLPALAALNPAAPDSGFPFPGLCGAGTAFYLAWAVRSRLAEKGVTSLPDLRELLDLVTLGTIADVVPLEAENRVLVRHGLAALTEGRRLGIAALKNISRVTNVTSSAVAFRLAPRLNAIGRLGSAQAALELLVTDIPERAQQLATELQDANRQRQALEGAILKDALALCRNDPNWENRRAIVLASSEWHPGVIGIVAARLVEKFGRPTVLIAIDENSGVGRGSVRSTSGVNCYRALADCAPLLTAFGGHHMAAGFSIAVEHLEAFAQAFDEAVAKQTRAPQPTVHWADAVLELDQIDPADLASCLVALEPFGPGNPEPVFFARGVRLRAAQTFGGQHLRLFAEQRGKAWPAMWFQWGDEFPPDPNSSYDVLFSIEAHSSNGEAPLRLRLLRLRPSRSAER